MKVVHIVNSDIRGGASKAAFALNKALVNIGVDSKMLVQRKSSNNDNVFSISNSFLDKQKTNSRIFFDLVQMKIFTKTKKGRFSFGNIGTDLTKDALIKRADLIHLHWINEGYISLKSLSKLSKLKKPIVWTLHDMWAFTGGCHYSSGCIRYLDSCGLCPYLIFTNRKDSSYKIFKEKKKLYNQLKITYLTCSEWLANVAKGTPLLKDRKVIPIHNTLDINIYKPLHKNYIREKLNLPKDKFYILFVALSTDRLQEDHAYEGCYSRGRTRHPHQRRNIQAPKTHGGDRR